MKLTNDAAQLLGAFLHQTQLTPDQEQAIINHGDKELTKDQLAQVLQQTPDNMQQALNLIRASKCDDKPYFRTSFSGDIKSINETAVAIRRNAFVGQRNYDPQEIPLELDPRGRFFILASTSKFEDNVAKPRPVLLKVLIRTEGPDGVPTEKDLAAAKEFFDSCKVHKNFWNMRAADATIEQDITWIGSERASIVVHEHDEREIGHGNGVNVITMDRDMGEISRVNQLDPENIERRQNYNADAQGQPNLASPVGGPQDSRGVDNNPPQLNNYNLQVRISAKDLPRGTWIADPGLLGQLSIGMGLGTKWMMEAGTNGTASLLGMTLKTNVPADDTYYVGSAPAKGLVEVMPPHIKTIADVFNQVVSTARGRTNTADLKFKFPEANLTAQNFSVRDLYFQKAQGVMFAGTLLSPMADAAIYSKAAGNPTISAEKRPAAGNANLQDQVITLKLKDLLTPGDKGADVNNWTIDAGIKIVTQDPANPGQPKIEWQAAETNKGKDQIKIGPKGSGEQEIKITIPNYEQVARSGQPIQLIVRNDQGLPVGRIQIPLNEIDWAKDAK